MSEFVFCSLGAVRRDLIRTVERVSDDMSHLLLDGADGPAEISHADGELIIGQLLLPAPTAAAPVFTENAACEVVRRGQPLRGGFFAESEGCTPAPVPAGRIFTAPDGVQVGSWSGSRSDVAGPVTLEVSVSPVDGGTWSGGGPPQPVFRLRVDAPKQHWTVCLPHGAARGLIRELESYVDTHG